MCPQLALVDFMDDFQKLWVDKAMAYRQLLRNKWGGLHWLVDDRCYILDRIDKRFMQKWKEKNQLYYSVIDIVENELDDIAKGFENRPKDYMNQAIAIWFESSRSTRKRWHWFGLEYKYEW